MSRQKTKLSVKQKKYVAGIVQGKSQREAALKAGAKTPIAADQYAQRLSKNVEVQKAIDEALESQGATPEYAVKTLKEVADQTKEIGARRLAAKDILELHGWQRGQRPTVTLELKDGFFRTSREIVDVDSS